jgi:hypothetical protein
MTDRISAEELLEVYGDEPMDLDAGYYESESDGRFAEVAGDQASADDRADWHVRRGLAVKAAAEAEDVRYKRALKALNDRRKEAAAKHQRAYEWHLAALRGWHKAFHRGTASVSLPSGSYRTRYGGWALAVADGDGWEEQLRDVLAEVDEGLVEKVFVPQPDAFAAGALAQMVANVDGDDARPEPGSPVRLVWKDTGEPVDVELLSGKVKPGSHWVQR